MLLSSTLEDRFYDMTLLVFLQYMKYRLYDAIAERASSMTFLIAFGWRTGFTMLLPVLWRFRQLCLLNKFYAVVVYIQLKNRLYLNVVLFE
jgi:hypothetical protein